MYDYPLTRILPYGVQSVTKRGITLSLVESGSYVIPLPDPMYNDGRAARAYLDAMEELNPTPEWWQRRFDQLCEEL